MGAREAAFWHSGAAVFFGAYSAAAVTGVLACRSCNCGVLGAGAGSRLLLVQGWHGLVPWIAGAVFLPSLALALGVWSGSGKAFEGLLTANVVRRSDESYARHRLSRERRVAVPPFMTL